METVAVFRNVCPHVPIDGTVGPKKSVNSWIKQYDTMELMHLMSSMQQYAGYCWTVSRPNRQKRGRRFHSNIRRSDQLGLPSARAIAVAAR